MPNPTNEYELICFVHNRGGQRLRNALASLARQKKAPPFGVTIVDYGSDRDCVERNDELCAWFHARHIVIPATVWNKARALNYAIKRSEAPIIGTFDVDMIFSDNTLAAVERAFSENPASFLVCQVYDLPKDADTNNLEQYAQPKYLHPSIGLGGLQIASRNAFHTIRGYDERMLLWGGMDVDLANRMQRAGLTMVHLNDYGVQAYHQWHSRAGKSEPTANRIWRRNNDLIGGPVVKNLWDWGVVPTETINRPHQIKGYSSAISVVTGTYNRGKTLIQAIESARKSSNGLPLEFIVVDGGSTDDTEKWCLRQPDVTFIAQQQLVGAIKAYNAGFAEAHGRFVVHINDDCIVLPNCIYNAYMFLLQAPDAGQVAFLFSDTGGEYQTGAFWASRYPYANFGMTRRWLGDLVGWWGKDYVKYAGDAELSLKIWARGYKVVVLPECKVDHFRVADELRMMMPINKEQRIFYKKWSKFGNDIEMPPYPLIIEEDAQCG